MFCCVVGVCSQTKIAAYGQHMGSICNYSFDNSKMCKCQEWQTAFICWIFIFFKKTNVLSYTDQIFRINESLFWSSIYKKNAVDRYKVWKHRSWATLRVQNFFDLTFDFFDVGWKWNYRHCLLLDNIICPRIWLTNYVKNYTWVY